MHEIQMHEMSKAFFPCWKAAANHLDNHMDGDFASWLRAHPYPPFLEHLSFRLGNQLFFVQVEDVGGKVMGPGNPIGCVAAARNADGHACILPMKRSALDGTWAPDLPGWSLVDAENGKPIDPLGLVTEQKIEMTPWELHDMAVQIVRGYMERRGFEMISWQSNPEFDPSIWFVGTDKQPEWVVVRQTSHSSQTMNHPRHSGEDTVCTFASRDWSRTWSDGTLIHWIASAFPFALEVGLEWRTRQDETGSFEKRVGYAA